MFEPFIPPVASVTDFTVSSYNICYALLGMLERNLGDVGTWAIKVQALMLDNGPGACFTVSVAIYLGWLGV